MACLTTAKPFQFATAFRTAFKDRHLTCSYARLPRVAGVSVPRDGNARAGLVLTHQIVNSFLLRVVDLIELGLIGRRAAAAEGIALAQELYTSLAGA